MKLLITVFCLVVFALADVSHLKQSGYVYNVPSPVFEIPSAPVKEYLPPTTPAPIHEEILPEILTPGPEYLPPVEVPAPIIPVAPSNEYLPPSEPEPVPEIIEETPLEQIIEPVKEYLPPSEAPVVIQPTEEYHSAAETGGYRYEAPLTKFRF